MEDDLFLSNQHPLSQRWAILDDDGTTGWLYLTEPVAMRPVADCWLYNREKALEGTSFERGDTPVVPQAYTTQVQGCASPEAGVVRFQWAVDGNSVAVWFGAELMGFIAGAEGVGYSRYLKEACAYGAPLDLAMHASVFGDV